jgi:hypothetical protein
MDLSSTYLKISGVLGLGGGSAACGTFNRKKQGGPWGRREKREQTVNGNKDFVSGRWAHCPGRRHRMPRLNPGKYSSQESFPSSVL